MHDNDACNTVWWHLWQRLSCFLHILPLDVTAAWCAAYTKYFGLAKTAAELMQMKTASPPFGLVRVYSISHYLGQSGKVDLMLQRF